MLESPVGKRPEVETEASQPRQVLEEMYVFIDASSKEEVSTNTQAETEEGQTEGGGGLLNKGIAAAAGLAQAVVATGKGGVASGSGIITDVMKDRISKLIALNKRFREASPDLGVAFSNISKLPLKTSVCALV